MDFVVERTTSEGAEHPVYSLLDSQGAPLLRAEQAQGPFPDERQQIRLLRPGGRLLATIDLPQVEMAGKGPEGQIDYAIIHEFAVYAIVSVCRRPDTAGDGAFEQYYLLEVEGETWLVLPHPEEVSCYAIYDEAPAGLHAYEKLTELDLPPAIGRICRQEEETTLTITLAPRRLKHTGLLLLALALLVDRSGALP